ncbi:MAG: glycosyltransferase family 2 protein [Saprospiraceae bacterium]
MNNKINPHISIVIVNYNVRHFIKRCIESIYKSKTLDLLIDIHVVDNASIDGSVDMIKSEFPKVRLISNTENVGFSTANNQAIKLCKSKYILILNPDTVVQEDTLQICYEYMDNHLKVGALGVKMIDGSGAFLPESKRSLPTIWNSISKLSGLSNIFPNSSLFNGYALGHLDKDKQHKIEVLCGAFMFVRQSIIEKVGMFDERFFMYAEDIDWSKRIIEKGHEVHYIPETTIIHFKGESTKKASLGYVKTFYSAMALYVEKHYTGITGKWFAKILTIGITLRAMISSLKRIVEQSVRPFIDGALSGLSLYCFSQLWEEYYFQNSEYYSQAKLLANIGGYVLIWSIVLWYVGYYKKTTFQKRFVGVLSGLVLILAVYALLPEDYRTSRVILLAGAIITLIISSITTLIFKQRSSIPANKKILIVAKEQQAKSIVKSLSKANVNSEILGIVYPETKMPNNLIYLNDISQLGALSKVLKAEEIIFSADDMSMKDIMHQMVILDTRLSYKIAGDDSLSILGSSSKNTTGELYSVKIKYNLEEEYYHHTKRSFDFGAALLLLLVSPILLIVNGFQFSIFKNIFIVLIGKKTWVGYIGNNNDYQNLPNIKKGILNIPIDDNDDIHKTNMHYAKNYSVWQDLEHLRKGILKLH